MTVDTAARGVARDTAGDKAAVLAEALPYIRRFWGKVVVVKYGGAAMADERLAGLFAQDVVLMRSVGMRPVVVHGGGPQIGELMSRLGKVPEFRDGMRVTDAETLDIARMVLVGKVNRDIVSAINVLGPLAVGLSGEDAGLITAAARSPELGFVGDVASVNTSIVNRLLTQELITPRSSCTSPTWSGCWPTWETPPASCIPWRSPTSRPSSPTGP
jgi:acetylglutamate kinase